MLRRLWSFVPVLGNAATYVLGLAALAALLLGPVSVGLAAVGDPILAGKATNAANKATSLVANLAGPVLRLTNQAAGPALDLRVQSGRPPLKVNSDAKVANLNADKLDGQEANDFLAAGGTAVNAEQLDGKDAADFLAVPNCPGGTVFAAGSCIETARRAAAAWVTAQNSCLALPQGGRLPTVGELQAIRGDSRFNLSAATEWTSELAQDGTTGNDLIIRVNGSTGAQSFAVESVQDPFRCVQTPG